MSFRRVMGSAEGRNFASLTVSQGVVALAGLASTRYLDPAHKGLVTGGYLWSAIGYSIMGLSLPYALIYFSSRGMSPYLSRKVGLLVSAATLLAGLGVAYFLGVAKGAPATFWILLVALPGMMLRFDLVSYRQLSLSGVFYGRRLAQALLYGLPGIWLVSRYQSPAVFLLALIVSYVLASISGVSRAPSGVPRIDRPEVAQWARTAHPGVLFAALASKLDVLTVTLLASSSVAGHYAAAAAVPSLFSFAGTALGLATSRRSAAESVTDRGVGHKPIAVSLLLFIGLLMISTFVFIFAGDIVEHLFGRAYASAIAPLRILVFAMPLWAVSTYLSHVMVVIGLARLQTRAQGVAAIILLGGSVFGTLHGSLQFVAASNLAAYGVASIWQVSSIRTHVQPHSSEVPP